MDRVKNRKFFPSLQGYQRDWYKQVLGLAQLRWVEKLENYVQNVFVIAQTKRRKEENRFSDGTLTGVVLGLSVLSVTIAIAPFETSTFAASPVARLDDWRYYPDASQLEFTLSTGTKPKLFYLAQPPRIVVDLPSTKLGNISTQQNYSGAIQRIRVSQLKAGVTRIVMDLAPGAIVDRNQLQLQPLDGQNSTRWVLRPFAGGYTNYPQPPQPSNYPPGIYNAPQPNNYPPGIYNAPQPNNYPSGIYNAPQPNNYPSGIYNAPQPNNYPSGIYNAPQMPTVNVPPPSSALPPAIFNPQQQQQPAIFNNQLPTVNVPPPTQNNLSQPNNILPPATFPPMSGNLNNIAPFPAPTGLTVPTVPNSQPPNYQPFNSQPNVPGSRVIEFGQPIPNRR
jgi:AMIN domain